MVSQLPSAEREAFEDAVLQQLKSNEKWRKAYDSNALSMPAVAEYANNAYLREVSRAASRPEPRREVTAAEAMENARAAIMANDEAQFAKLRAHWERDAPPEQPHAQRGSGFSFPRENEMSDGIAFQEAARVQREWNTVDPRDRGPDAMSDAVAFNAVEQATVARITAGSDESAPVKESDPFQEAARVQREWNTVDPRYRGPDAMSDAVAFNAVEQATVARITAGSDESAPVKESDPFQEAARVQREWNTVDPRYRGPDAMSDAVAFNAVEQATVARITAGPDESAPVYESDPFREAERATLTWAGSSEPAVPHLISKVGRQVLSEQLPSGDGTSSPSLSTPAVPAPVRSNAPSSRAVR
ncbi:hypothetical protein ACWDGI_43225 [Streptomyces sp. NPDC001220]